MPALKNSANSRASKASLKAKPANVGFRGAAQVFVLAAMFGSLAAAFVWSRGYTFYYGDAEAHFNIARRIFDSRTPGPSQIGTVWLPLPHLLMALAGIDSLWINGLAGVIPSVACFALACSFLYAATQRAFHSSHAALAATLLFATNATMLYLASIPMTEPVMAAAITALLWATIYYRDTRSPLALLIVAAVSNAASLTRYDGWFLIPFVAIYIWIAGNRTHAIWFTLLACLAPLSWLAHNQFYYGDAFAFFRGPYSAKAILARQLSEGVIQPAAKNWTLAAKYYAFAVRNIIGIPLLSLAALGTFVALYRRAYWPLLFLLLPGPYYIASIHSGDTLVFIRELAPYTLYNTRFALGLLPAAAFAAAAIFTILPGRIRVISALAVTLAIALPQYRVPVSLSWEEARIASEARRVWTADAAAFLKSNYRGGGIVFWFGDLAGVFRQAGIPFREGVYQDNVPDWENALSRSSEQWALTVEGDPVDRALDHSSYRPVHRIETKGAPAVIVYRHQ